MLNNITWQGYWVTLAILATGYYLAVYLLYYRSDFKISFPRKRESLIPGNHSSFASYQSPTLFDDEKEFELPPKESEERLIYSLMDELGAYFQEAKRSKVVKEEFLFALQRLFSKYPTVKTSPYKESITNVMVSEAEHVCSIHLCAEDISKVWLE